MPRILPPAMPKLVAQITLVMPAAFECELREQRLREAIARGLAAALSHSTKLLAPGFYRPETRLSKNQ
jgi:hypothetical protein